MPGPTLTADEIAQLTADKAKAESAAATFAANVAGQTAQAAKYAVTDGAFKKFFDYYNAIIGSYDTEQQWINGRVITSPVVEADIVACANLTGNRIQPTLPLTDITRITEFDGGGTTTNPANELQYISDQATVETALVSGFGGSAPAASVLTNSTITGASTTLQLKDLTLTYSIAPNSTFVITNGSDFAVVKILTFVMQAAPVPPPYIADCTIQVLIAPSSTIPTGKTLQVFSGFTNGERTAKTATFQGLMNYYVALLQSKINSRITALNNQLSAISGNTDPQPGSELTTATTNVNTSKTFLTAYLVSTDISNIGLTSLSTERTTRTTQANARVTQITNAYTGRSTNYYNARYNYANSRANTARGSLRIQKATEQNASASQGFADTLTAQAAAISALLP
jgi:hypothetical protein